MIFDPDHMSVKARQASLDGAGEAALPGRDLQPLVVHPGRLPADLRRLGGFITPYAGDSTGFVDKWREHLTWADPRYYFGFGYGADINGLGAQGDPRPDADAKNPVTYPFTGLGRGHGATSSAAASGSTTSTWTASPTTASTPTGSRTCEMPTPRGDGASSPTCSAAPRPTCRCGSGRTGVHQRRLPPAGGRPSARRCSTGLRRGLTVAGAAAGRPAARAPGHEFTYCARRPGGAPHARCSSSSRPGPAGLTGRPLIGPGGRAAVTRLVAISSHPRCTAGAGAH